MFLRSTVIYLHLWWSCFISYTLFHIQDIKRTCALEWVTLGWFFQITLLQAGMNACHTQEQEKYWSYMFYVSIFQLFWTFVSYNYTFGAKKSYHKIIMCEPNLLLLGNRKYPGIYMCYIICYITCSICMYCICYITCSICMYCICYMCYICNG